MRRRRFAQLMAAGSMFGFPNPASAQVPLETIRLVITKSDAATPYYYGLRTDAYKRAGIDLELTHLGSGDASLQAVIGGSYEIGVVQLVPVMEAYLRGIAIRVVAPQGVYTAEHPFTLLQIAADSTIKTGADLNGKTIGVAGLNDITDLGAMAWCDKHGGDISTLKFVEVPVPALEEAIARHRVDAGLMLEPFLDNSLAAGTTKTLGDPFSAIGQTFAFGGCIARTDWANDHADVLRRFVRVTEQLSSYCNAHPDETAPMMAEVTHIPLPILQKMKRIFFATSLDARIIQPLIDAAARYQITPRSFPASEILWNGR